MTQTNGETKLQKFHSVMQKVLKYGIVLALIAFIVLVLMNKDQFSEKVAKGTPEHKLTKIEVTDGDKVVQKFKAVSHTMERLDIMIDRNEQTGRAGSIDLNVKDSKGKSIFHITPTLLEVDGLTDMKATMRRTLRNENKWYKVVVNQKLNKGETYTIEITGKGIKAERPLYLYTSSNMGKIYQSAKLNGVTQKNFHVRTRVWTTQLDVSAVVLTVISPSFTVRSCEAWKPSEYAVIFTVPPFTVTYPFPEAVSVSRACCICLPSNRTAPECWMTVSSSMMAMRPSPPSRDRSCTRETAITISSLRQGA